MVSRASTYITAHHLGVDLISYCQRLPFMMARLHGYVWNMGNITIAQGLAVIEDHNKEFSFTL